jgi:hypothetical protein
MKKFGIKNAVIFSFVEKISGNFTGKENTTNLCTRFTDMAEGYLLTKLIHPCHQRNLADFGLASFEFVTNYLINDKTFFAFFLNLTRKLFFIFQADRDGRRTPVQTKKNNEHNTKNEEKRQNFLCICFKTRNYNVSP